jgi:L-lactate dehydrogenase complex protein LldF
MDFLIGQARRPVSRPEELESLRTLGEQIRQYNLGKLPDCWCKLEAKA